MLVIVVGLFGIIGALLRDGVSLLTAHWWIGPFPLATWIINMVGCLILGWFTTYIKQIKGVHLYIKTGVGTGLIGSFTTFSTFSVETIQLFETGNTLLGILYLLTSYIGGWAFAFLGFKLGHFMIIKRKGEAI